MNYMMMDTCVLLDISTNKKDIAIVSALEELVQAGIIKILTSEIINEEYNRNKEDVADKTRKRLNQEFKVVRNVVQEFGGDKKESVVDELDDISSRLPILSEVNYSTVSRVEKLLGSSISLSISDKVQCAAVKRGLEKKAPFHSGKNSVADAVLIELFYEFSNSMNDSDNQYIFVTHNHHDFSSTDHRQPHEDFSEIFNHENIHYFNNMYNAIQIINEDVLSEAQFDYDYTEETRGLTEILFAMDELVDKIWYNRHQNLLCRIDRGETRIVPDGTKEYGGTVIHESILKGAKKAAKKVEEKYEDTGPWDDFEWGMLNGKLSALRWVLGDEWDMLDT